MTTTTKEPEMEIEQEEEVIWKGLLYGVDFIG